MGDQRFNLSERDRWVIAKALRKGGYDLRIATRGTAMQLSPYANDRWEESSYCEALADKMHTSA